MTVENIKPLEAAQKIEKEGFVYLDVRTPEEFKAGHAKGAVNIPLLLNGPAGREPNPRFMEKVRERFSPESKLVVGCLSGGRSSKACAMMAEEGFECVCNIDGGFGGKTDPATGKLVKKGWRQEGLPCE